MLTSLDRDDLIVGVSDPSHLPDPTWAGLQALPLSILGS